MKPTTVEGPVQYEKHELGHIVREPPKEISTRNIENAVIKSNSFNYLTYIQDKSVDVILTDPPYDFNYDQITYLQDHFRRIARKAIIVFSPPENQWWHPVDQYLFWQKPISTKNTTKSYGRFMEMVFLYQLENYTYNTDLHWSNYTNIFTDKVEGISPHPYEKPVSLIRRLIKIHTNVNNIVLDPFCGGGIIPSTAFELDRRFIAIDKEEKSVNWTKELLQTKGWR